jgi:hypothetical protein
MGQAKVKQREGFAVPLIDEWEADDCVNFAIALARKTGWLLHVDWWSSRQEDITEAEMIPLRVYVADNHEGIFDVRGVKTLADFTSSTITRLANQRGSGFGGVLTRYYSETKLLHLPLRCTPDETKIAMAKDAIVGNAAYLNAIPPRPPSGIPAHDAARYTFGRCVAYAEAMRELVQLRPVAILGKRFTPVYERCQRRSADGYVHSIVVHPNGMGEDAWGIAPIADIAGRFGVIDFEISEAVHQEVVANYHRTSYEIYEAELKVAKSLIMQYRLPGGIQSAE